MGAGTIYRGRFVASHSLACLGKAIRGGEFIFKLLKLGATEFSRSFSASEQKISRLMRVRLVTISSRLKIKLHMTCRPRRLKNFSCSRDGIKLWTSFRKAQSFLGLEEGAGSNWLSKLDLSSLGCTSTPWLKRVCLRGSVQAPYGSGRIMPLDWAFVSSV